ncbi:MAG: PilT/PilU family type 4a pilus ATPase [Actinobacteria bacterium]|nr:PilT/PilU family type 4a pilus ATPase [Actinomycetota bacterium]
MKPIDDVLREMMAHNASDVHIKAGSPPVIRVDGELLLLDQPPLTPEDTKDVAASIMTDRQIRRFSEHNEIDFAYSAATLGRFRVNVFRQRGSISVAMRHVATKIPSFEELHLPEIIKRIALEPRGLVLVTGTTGSGKTTTLAAMIDQINNTIRRHIVTIEDPIEVLHKDKRSIINQREIGLDTDSYVSALKYVLRQVPDDILIGEMRDTETVAAALTAAQTGHFVMSTLHTIDATETINRIIDFFPLHQQKQVRIMLAGTLKAIVSQRLLTRADGAGRVPAIEIMITTNRIRDFILNQDQGMLINDAIKEGDFYGMQTFDQALLHLYEEGLITLSDAAQAASNPHDFKLLVQQKGHDVSLMTF